MATSQKYLYSKYHLTTPGFLTDDFMLQKLNAILATRIDRDQIADFTVRDLIPFNPFFRDFLKEQYFKTFTRQLNKENKEIFKLLTQFFFKEYPRKFKLDYFFLENFENFYNGYFYFFEGVPFYNDGEVKNCPLFIPKRLDTASAFIENLGLGLKNPYRFWLSLQHFRWLMRSILNEPYLYSSLNNLPIHRRLVLFKLRELEFRYIFSQINQSFISYD